MAHKEHIALFTINATTRVASAEPSIVVTAVDHATHLTTYATATTDANGFAVLTIDPPRVFCLKRGTDAVTANDHQYGLGMQPRFPAVVVAASNASLLSKAWADDVLSGSADVARMQAAIDLAGAGGMVQLTEGTFDIQLANLEVPDDFTFAGVGWQTILNVTGAITGCITKKAATTKNVTIRDMQVDGNDLGGTALALVDLYPGTGYKVENVWVHHTQGIYGIRVGNNDSAVNADHRVEGCLVEYCVNSTNGKGIAIRGAAVGTRFYGFHVRGNTVRNCSAQGIWTAYANEGEISGNVCQDNDEGGVWVSYNSQDVSVMNNILTGGSTATATNLCFPVGGDRNIAIGNIITGGRYGIQSYHNECLIQGNIIQGTLLSAIYIGLTTPLVMANLIIADNVIIGPGTGGNGHGIAVNSTATEFVTGLVISGNIVKASNYRAIWVAAYHKEVRVTDNSVVGTTSADGIGFLISCGYATISGNLAKNNAAYGIQIAGNYNNVFGNMAYDDQTPKTQTYGIYEGASSDFNNIFGNMVADNLTANIFRTGASTRIWGNIGFLAPGEQLVHSAALAAGNANAYSFNWQNPHAVKIIIKRVLIYLSTAGGTATSVLDVGPAASTGTHSDTLIDGLDLNTTGAFDNLNDAGTNGKSRQLVDENGGTNDWVTGQILVANAASLVGRYELEYVGV